MYHASSFDITEECLLYAPDRELEKRHTRQDVIILRRSEWEALKQCLIGNRIYDDWHNHDFTDRLLELARLDAFKDSLEKAATSIVKAADNVRDAKAGVEWK